MLSNSDDIFQENKSSENVTSQLNDMTLDDATTKKTGVKVSKAQKKRVSISLRIMAYKK